MKSFAAVAAFVAGAHASVYGYYNASSTTSGYAVSYTTTVVPTYVTYCSESTEITHGTHTYTVSKPGTITITDCPCTITAPVYSTSTTVCESSTTSHVPSATPISTGSYYPTTTPVVAGAGKAAPMGAAAAAVLGFAALL